MRVASRLTHAPSSLPCSSCNTPPYLQLACARIGAVHAVVFGGFSAEALAGRIEGCKAKVGQLGGGAICNML